MAKKNGGKISDGAFLMFLENKTANSRSRSFFSLHGFRVASKHHLTKALSLGMKQFSYNI